MSHEYVSYYMTHLTEYEFQENRCTVEASFLDAEMKLLNQTISIVCNNPSELHQLGFHSVL